MTPRIRAPACDACTIIAEEDISVKPPNANGVLRIVRVRRSAVRKRFFAAREI